ncbi:MAG: hypothetical protein HYV01_03790 [Deltaproteobacteria bacterium]|nr:hypothetical protein [Deltaproteobacteria bacterium]
MRTPSLEQILILLLLIVLPLLHLLFQRAKTFCEAIDFGKQAGITARNHLDGNTGTLPHFRPARLGHASRSSPSLKIYVNFYHPIPQEEEAGLRKYYWCPVMAATLRKLKR